jgi:hypothetical protein
MMAVETPKDLIPIQEAMDLVNHSRYWIKQRVQVYQVGRTDMVSKAAVEAAEREYSTPRPKDGRNEG